MESNHRDGTVCHKKQGHKTMLQSNPRDAFPLIALLYLHT